MSATARLIWLWAPPVMSMAAIFLASADSDPPAPAAISDKVLHLAAYAGLAALVSRAVTGGLGRRVTRRAALITFIVSVAYGISDEVHQMFVPQRSPDVFDVIADAAGAGLGLIGCWAWGIIRTPNPQLPTSNSRS